MGEVEESLVLAAFVTVPRATGFSIVFSRTSSFVLVLMNTKTIVTYQFPVSDFGSN